MQSYEDMMGAFEQLSEDPMFQQVFWITFIVTLAVMAIVSIVFYILGAIGLRRLSITAELPHPGFAFIPILRWSQLGKLAECKLPREKAGRKTFAYSVHLPILMTLSFLLEMAYSVFVVYYSYIAPDAAIPDNLAGLMNGVSLAYSVIQLIASVVLLLALYRVFTLIGCQSAMILTLLCALISICHPLLLFAYRKNKVAVQPISAQNDNNSDDSGFYYDNK